jgi:hypothetical protein
VITLARGPGGSLTTTLPDHRGREVRYRVRPLPDGTGVEMDREDGEGTYITRRGRHGWGCNCKAFAFSKAQPPVCKHAVFAADYLDLVGLAVPGGRGAGFVQVT